MWRIERRTAPTAGVAALVPLVSILLALLLGALLLLLAGQNPLVVYGAMLNGAFGSLNGVAETIVKTIPLSLAALGVGIAFRMLLWNIGAEGQLYFGAIAATGLALYVMPWAPTVVLLPMMVLAGFVGGALWGLIPGALRAFLNVNEIITSLMLNYVAILFSEYLVHGPWRNPQGLGFPGTRTLPDSAWLPRLSPTRVHLGLLLAVIAAGVLFVILRRTWWGYEIRVIGENQRAARYAGINIPRNMLLVMAVSGGLAGIAGMSEVAGIAHQLQRSLSPGYGYTAIIVAWLAKLNPWSTLMVAFLFAGLLVGGDQLQISMGLPAAIAPMLQGTILFFLLGGEVLSRYRLTKVRPGPTPDLNPAQR
ncbi:MAG: ABC transporter permease [Chloroflexi bacterium]|nr:MAG: ABC transporter permease [Chloroflexota bacterium]